VTFLVSDEVRSAVERSGAVVGLETSVIGQGLPYPRNVECIERMDAAIVAAGGVPAWTGVVDGAMRVGLDRPELRRFAESGEATKVARRDVPIAIATGALGATTVSAAIWAAHRAGIVIGATGGIGGVHPGPRPDVSADLLELAVTPVMLVCSGPKSILDPAATAEKLEELSVALVGYGVDRLPFFTAREAPVELEHRVDTPDGAAAIVRAMQMATTPSAVVLCNPVPTARALVVEELLAATARAEARLEAADIEGKAVTPFLLGALAEETDGRSMEANLDLLEDNARVASEVATALSGARSG
jgi:pseudouridine-5'-phosphate glycosidase